jgi:hypothetical protein
MTIDFRRGRWENVLGEVTCDALIVDAPYSARVHRGHDAGVDGARLESGLVRADGSWEPGRERRALGYQAWAEADVRAFVSAWHPRTRGWIVTLTDHYLARVWEDELRAAGRYVFSPVACVEPGSRVRLQGDGPSQWSTWCVVARTAALSKWGTLPGAYVVPAGQGDTRGDRPVTGGKPLWLMRSLVRDYSRRGDVVCDPCAGGATTLIAASMEGRTGVGSEADTDSYDRAVARIARGYTPTLFG